MAAKKQDNLKGKLEQFKGLWRLPVLRLGLLCFRR